jgi:hypothetical protein
MTLRAVQDGEKPARKPRSKTVTQAAEKGTTRELLVAMRTRIAKAVESENTPAVALAALTKRLVEVARDIEAIDARAEEDQQTSGPVPDAAFDVSAI